MPDRKLLEEAPLYKPIVIDLPIDRSKWMRPGIRARCLNCKSDETFTLDSDYNQWDKVRNPTSAGAANIQSQVLRLVYTCASCERYRRYYLLHVQPGPRLGNALAPPSTTVPTTLTKVGQFPAVSISVERDLEKQLGEHVEVYKKGLISESHGFGIGAFAYYRRIVEDTIDELLDAIAELVSPDQHDEYAAALAVAKRSHVASEKIEHVKHLLPAVLRPGGTNPLDLLHGALSVGIHTLPDAECLERAGAVRGALVFLVNQIRVQREATGEFNKQIKTLLDTKSKGQS